MGDLEPRRLGTDEDVLAWRQVRSIDEQAQRDVHVLALAHDRIEQRASDAAPRVIQFVAAPDEELVSLW